MEPLRRNYNRILSIKTAKKLIWVLFFILFFDYLLFPTPTLAADVANAAMYTPTEAEAIIEENTPDPEFNANLPENASLAVVRTSYHVITSYNSEIGQCDDSPCITANGFNVCEHGIEDTIAANFLKFGTKVRIPELFGDQIFVVRDRMNARYDNRIDVWMVNKADAKTFGVKYAKIEILE
jgi:3D (Asp-Asp-Asp) domain-containing protein